MTPKEKAKELVGKYYTVTFIDEDGYAWYETLSHGAAKQSALIAVEEILGVLFQHHEIDYWKQVKQEIEKL